MVGSPGLISVTQMLVYKFKCVDCAITSVVDSDNDPVACKVNKLYV